MLTFSKIRSLKNNYLAIIVIALSMFFSTVEVVDLIENKFEVIEIEKEAKENIENEIELESKITHRHSNINSLLESKKEGFIKKENDKVCDHISDVPTPPPRA